MKTLSTLESFQYWAKKWDAEILLEHDLEETNIPKFNSKKRFITCKKCKVRISFIYGQKLSTTVRGEFVFWPYNRKIETCEEITMNEALK